MIIITMTAIRATPTIVARTIPNMAPPLNPGGLEYILVTKPTYA